MRVVVNKLTINKIYNSEDTDILSDCTLCPRECHVNRFETANGICGSDAGMNIASICIHRGEEPAISGRQGICNIFFSGCNLGCIYCQNHEISRPDGSCRNSSPDYTKTLDIIEGILSNGVSAVGFVSPSHVVPQVRAIIRGLNERGLFPVTVYNTNSYDKQETLRSLEGLINVYLPDYKYVTPSLSKELSGAPDYPEVALKAIKEMYYQKGSVLSTDEQGRAMNGILLRHLVLPGHAEESRRVLSTLAEEVSTGISLSLMSQYHPTHFIRDHPFLNRSLTREEYYSVVETMEELGFRNGWIQNMESHNNYTPDFRKEHPFE
jgi:putative pyruvate formate lyase activating enzyme